MPRPRAVDQTLEGVIAALETLPGVETKLYKPSLSRSDDVFLMISAAGIERTFQGQVRNHISQKTMDAVLAAFRPFQEHWHNRALLLTTYLTDSVIDRLLAEQVQFIDTAGNMSLQQDGLYALIRGRPPLRTYAKEPFTPTNIKILYVILAFPYLRKGSYQQIADFADVGIASVSRAISHFRKLGILTKDAKSRLVITDYASTLERWVLSFIEAWRIRLGADGWHITPEGRVHLYEMLPSLNAVVSGDTAAGLLIEDFKPQSLTLLIPTEAQQKLKREILMFQDSKEPNLYLMRPFTRVDQFGKDENSGYRLAHPILVHAELLALGGEPRRSAATQILQEIILPDFGGGEA